MEPIGIGLAGFGTVGAGVFKNLQRNGSIVAQRMGASFAFRRIAVSDIAKVRPIQAPAHLLTTRLADLIEDDSIDVVIELMGGIDAPLAFVRSAINAGKIVITGNKALLAEHGPEIFRLANERRVPVFYEAAVAGGIPIIKSVREGFVGNRIESMHGILNGTSNYVLTRMTMADLSFSDALEEARQFGYAEADPTLDINGWDAAHKAIILAAIAYGFWLLPSQVHVEGIDAITVDDIRFARNLGYRIKLLATIKADARNAIEARVCPTLIPKDHVLASVNGVFNAIWLKGDIVGESLFYGRGAGQDPTSSSVIGDLAEAAEALQSPRKCCGFTAHDAYGKCKPIEESVSQHYLRLSVEDRPGVLAQVAGVLASNDIGISSVIQPEWHTPGPVPLVLMIHDAPLGAMRRAAGAIARLTCVKAQPALLQVETFA